MSQEQEGLSVPKKEGRVAFQLLLKHGQEVIYRCSGHAHYMHGSSRSQLDGNTINSVIARSFNYIDKIVSSQNGVLLKNLRTENLNLFVDFLYPFGF